MEPWQHGYLRDNIDKLLDNTMCNQMLLAKLTKYKMLSDYDQANIKCKPNRYDQAQHLYDILRTKKNGYSALAKALAKCKQSGAYDILRLGYAHSLPPRAAINFLGKTERLSKYFNQGEIEEIIQKTRAHISAKQYINLYDDPDAGGKAIKLVGNVAPPSEALYIPRKLYKRVIVNPNLYHADCPDIFVFSGIRLFRQLTDLVSPHIASLSSVQLTQDKLTSRFIQLEDAGDWADLLEITHVPTHLIRYDEQTKVCVLERTTGGSKVISQHLERPPGTLEDEVTDKIISEDTLIDTILNESGAGICICDSPGMGKTLLLAKLASKIMERSPDRLVAFIPLSNFIQNLIKHGIPEEVDAAYARNAILEYVSTSPLSLCILDRVLEKRKVHMELMLDGFDEVNFKYIDFTKKLLKEIATTFPNTRVYVTSRTHMKHELEGSLGVIAFDITPFTEANRIEFLVKFWTDPETPRNDNKLREFAHVCLRKLEDGGLSEEEKNITGIPLMCRLLGQVYSIRAKQFGKKADKVEGAAKDAFQFETSLPNLYTKYIERSFDKLANISELIPQAKNYHICKAFKTVFPDFETVFPEYNNQFYVSDEKEVLDSSVSMGILERRYSGKGETVEFVHRTFAEYFVSEFVAENLNKLSFSAEEKVSEKFATGLVRFFLENVLLTRGTDDTQDFNADATIFNYSVVTYFVNFFAQNFTFPLQTGIFSTQFPVSVPPTNLYPIYLGCVRDNRGNIFRFIHSIVMLLEISAREPYKVEIFAGGETQPVVRLINISSVYSSSELVDSLFNSFQDCFQFDLKLVCRELPVGSKTPLHFAIEKADVEKIQYFAQVIPLKGRNILESCVVRSNQDNAQIIKRKTEMVRLLVGKEPELLQEAPYLLCDNVHLSVLKALIEEGADLRQTKGEETIVHHAARYLSSEDFHELCRFLIQDREAAYLFKPNEEKWESPLPYTLVLKKDEAFKTIQMILNISGVDVDEGDAQGNSLFLIAVREKLIVGMLHLFLEAGASVNMTNNKRQNALHLAAITGNQKHIEFLLSYRIDCCACDSEGNTFLHVLKWKEMTPYQYHDLISLLSAEGQTEAFHIKNKRRQLPIHAAIANLEVKQETLQLYRDFNVGFNSVDEFGCSLLMVAAAARRTVKFITTLLDIGVNVMIRTEHGFTFTHIISEYYRTMTDDYHALVDLLIDRGYGHAFSVQTKEGITPLHYALLEVELLWRTLHLIHVKLVKEGKTDMNMRDGKGLSILMYAAKGKRSVRCLRTLMEIGADVMAQDKNGNTFAHYIAECYTAGNYQKVVEMLLETEHENVFSLTNYSGATPFHSAVKNLEILDKTLHFFHGRLFQTNLVDVNSVDISGSSLLVYAAMGKRNVATIKILIGMGVDVRSRDKNGNTFAHLMAKYYTAEEYHQLVELLISMGKQSVFGIANNRKQTPLHWAAACIQLQKDTLELINAKLVQAGMVDINSRDEDGLSVLTYAVTGLLPDENPENKKFKVEEEKRLLLVKDLVELVGADWRVKDKQKRGLAHVSASLGLFKHLKYFVDLGCDVNEEDEDGNNVLQCAVLHNAPENIFEMVTFLMGRGANKAHTNKQGKTLETIAIESGIREEQIMAALEGRIIASVDEVTYETSN